MGKTILKTLILGIYLTLTFSCNNVERNKELKVDEEKQILNASEIYSKTVNATCTIHTDLGLGSGFFVESNIVVTNYHVIENIRFAKISLNEPSKTIKVIGIIGVDKINDLALLMVDYKSEFIIPIENELPQPGTKIFSIGSPNGLSKSISDGLLSAKRNFDGRTLLQISVPISHGSSGCPILNEYGLLVGVAVGGIESANNVNFCIPINPLKTLIDFKQSYATKINSSNNSEMEEIENSEVTKSNDNQKNNEKSNSKNLLNKSFKIPYHICYGDKKEELLRIFHERKDGDAFGSNYNKIDKNSIKVYEFDDAYKVWIKNQTNNKCIKYAIVYTLNCSDCTNPWSDESENYYDIFFESANGYLGKFGNDFSVLKNAGYGGFNLEKCN